MEEAQGFGHQQKAYLLPGSSSAKEQGCICPGPENEAIAEAAVRGEASWIIADGCPVHPNLETIIRQIYPDWSGKKLDLGVPVQIFSPEQRQLLSSLRAVRIKRSEISPEDNPQIVLELTTDHLLVAQLDFMAKFAGVSRETLLETYILRGLEQDLGCMP